jgi:hypothetical protein
MNNRTCNVRQTANTILNPVGVKHNQIRYSTPTGLLVLPELVVLALRTGLFTFSPFGTNTQIFIKQ